jgi:hypothetical protein
MKVHNDLRWNIVTLAFCIILVLGTNLLILFTQTKVTSGSIAPTLSRQLPLTLTPIFDYPPPQTLAPTPQTLALNPYLPPMEVISPNINSDYPAPEVGSDEAQQAYTLMPTLTPVPTETPTPTPIVMANGWYLYTDAEAGYSVRYPPDSYINSGKSAGAAFNSVTIGFRLPGANGYQGMEIIIYSNPSNLPLEEGIVNQIFQDRLQNISLDAIKSIMKTSTTAGWPSITMSVYPFDAMVLIPIGNKVFFALASPNMEAGNPPDPEAVKLFYKILDTFTITSSQ